MDPDMLRKSIFQLFMRENRLSLDDVCDYLNQPREPVKKILDEIGSFNKRDRTYGLKEDY